MARRACTRFERSRCNNPVTGMLSDGTHLVETTPHPREPDSEAAFRAFVPRSSRKGKSMKSKLFRSAVVCAALLLALPPARADATVSYPTYSRSPGSIQPNGTAFVNYRAHAVNVQVGDCGRHKFYAGGLEAQTPHTCPSSNYRSTGSYSAAKYYVWNTQMYGCWGSVGCTAPVNAGV